MSLQVVTAPTEEPVTLDEARASSATAYADLTDAQLAAMIASARIRLERYLDRAIAEQTLALHRSCFPYGGIVLEWAAPLQSIETFSYRPYGGGAAIEIEEDVDFMLDPYAEPAIVYPYSGGGAGAAAPPPFLRGAFFSRGGRARGAPPPPGAVPAGPPPPRP